MSSANAIGIKETPAESTAATNPLDSRSFAAALDRIFSFSTMLAALLAVLAMLTVRSRFDDPDLWWHIKTGQIIWNSRSIPTTDLFSYTTHHHAWIPHEWLAQLILYLAYSAGGFSGLMIWFCIATSTLLILGYALCAAHSGNTRVAFLGALAIFFFSTVGFSIRPQMIGYILLIVAQLLLHFGKTLDRRLFLALPPLFALWINCHGSFFLGLILVAAKLGSSFLEFKLGSLVAEKWSAPARRMLATSLVLSLAALFLNPVGVKQILYPLDALLRQPVNLANISEWQPLVLTSARGVGLLCMIGCILLPLLLRCAELPLDELLMLLIGTWLAVSHERMLFVFGILSAPILCRLIAPWASDPAEARSAKRRRLPNFILIAASVAILVRTFPGSQELADQVARQSPVKAVEFIQSHRLSGPMLNDYTFGGYLIWAAPERPVFVDGRADIFDWTGVLSEYQTWANLQSQPDQLLDKYNIRYCLLQRQSPTARVIGLLGNWKQVYQDDNAIIFVRDQPQTARATKDKPAPAG